MKTMKEEMKIKTINIMEEEAKIELDNGLTIFCSTETALTLRIGDVVNSDDIYFGEEE